ncbi:hypothetical protein H2201_005670 [Coniosporium apollinis]|uniref:Cytochrome P450 monooxygenase n=1 Tax=Coniosporium apollinis TaxID=61459 RepID=A0ABQ9NPE1_9PEZI|nr:hypothetical protein H2201_005670 [Coniosporium apollinis]
MFSPLDWSAKQAVGALLLGALIVWVSYNVQQAVYNIFFHPLARFPGPRAAAATKLWKAYIECIKQESFCHKLEKLHAQYGDVVRVGPDELHFANPQAYHDIYNSKNKWDKEWFLYHSFNEDRSSFGFVTYAEAKERKDVLSRTFSPKAIEQSQGLVIEKVDALCAAFERQSKANKPCDLFYAFRCMSMDVITYLCFGASVDAIEAPDFKAPIIEAMDASLPVFVRFKHAEWYKNMIMNCPPNISRVVSPETAGLVDLQQILKKQISNLTENPENLAHLPHQMTIYHRLLDKEVYRSNTVPSPGSLYEEAQALMFGGGDTTGNTLMLGTFHLLKQPETMAKLKAELKEAWPRLSDAPPELRELERLPYLNAVAKEALRMSSGVISGLLRVVPAGGAKICETFVPEGTIVSIGSTFVHFNPKIFPNPHEWRPERWLENPDLDDWLVTFSRGPRMCLGINLAWAELRLCFTYVFRKFDMKLEEPAPKELPFRETFLPYYYGQHAKAFMTPVAA